MRSRDELRAARARLDDGDVAVVMTMGALHEGHATLIRRAREEHAHVVVTIFLNPLQFGPKEDLSRYPRTFDADLAICADAGVDLVFAPTPDVVYPEGDPGVRVSAGPLGDVLEGQSRPGHFDGMLTVVCKLMHLTRCDAAWFGQKDAQQLLLIRRMCRDLDLDVRVVAAPTVREPDGLAMSSRNTYLTDSDRDTARCLPRPCEPEPRPRPRVRRRCASPRGPSSSASRSRSSTTSSSSTRTPSSTCPSPTAARPCSPSPDGSARPASSTTCRCSSGPVDTLSRRSPHEPAQRHTVRGSVHANPRKASPMTSGTTIPRRLRSRAPGWTATADVIVVGSGVAGLTTALRLRRRVDRVLLVTKTVLDEGSTAWAQGGIAAVMSPEDSASEHVHDTLVAGVGLCDPEAVEALVREGTGARLGPHRARCRVRPRRHAARSR